MTETQRLATAHVKSILSTPIYRASDQERTHPIAVLNLDSGDTIRQTSFQDRALRDLAERYAALIGPMLG